MPVAATGRTRVAWADVEDNLSADGAEIEANHAANFSKRAEDRVSTTVVSGSVTTGCNGTSGSVSAATALVDNRIDAAVKEWHAATDVAQALAAKVDDLWLDVFGTRKRQKTVRKLEAAQRRCDELFEILMCAIGDKKRTQDSSSSSADPG